MVKAFIWKSHQRARSSVLERVLRVFEVQRIYSSFQHNSQKVALPRFTFFSCAMPTIENFGASQQQIRILDFIVCFFRFLQEEAASNIFLAYFRGLEFIVDNSCEREHYGLFRNNCFL